MPRNKYPEETVQIILDSALKLFLEKGYEQTTILDIVDGMGGLTRGAFYHHFKAKEEVLDALSDRLFYANNPFDEVKQLTNLNALEKLKYILTDTLQPSERRELSIMSVAALQSPAFLKKLIDDNRDVLAPMYREIIEDGVKDGSIQTDHPKLLAELFTFMTNFWAVPTLFQSTPDEAVERLLYIKEVSDKMGLPVLGDEIIALVVKATEEMVIE